MAILGGWVFLVSEVPLYVTNTVLCLVAIKFFGWNGRGGMKGWVGWRVGPDLLLNLSGGSSTESPWWIFYWNPLACLSIGHWSWFGTGYGNLGTVPFSKPQSWHAPSGELTFNLLTLQELKVSRKNRKARQGGSVVTEREIFKYKYMNMYMYIYIYVYIYMYVNICLYIHIYIYKNMYI